MRTSHIIFLIIVYLLLFRQNSSAQQIITLTWDEVIGISRVENLDLQIQREESRFQNLNQWKAGAEFLPSLTYQFQMINNIERPVFVIPGFGQVRFGTEYNFTHVLQLQYPLFTGGSRWANWRIQKNLKQSLSETLKNKEDEVVLQALEAYFQVMLTRNLIKVNERARMAAEANLGQVQKFYDLGAASQLDLLRAKSRYSSSLPALTTAINSRDIALQNLKFVLNIDPGDSLVVLDTLREIHFLENFSKINIQDLQEMAINQRPDLKGAEYQKDAVSNQKILSASRFLPSIALAANVQHQAQVSSMNVQSDDFIRSKSVLLNLQIPLFQGGKRVLDYQQARINEKKTSLQLDQFRRAILLEVENSYNKFKESKTNLSSLQQSMLEAKEALRLADLTYQEGISTQVDVLAAQLALTNSEVQYQQGIYQYNISQLELMKAAGKINLIWTN